MSDEDLAEIRARAESGELVPFMRQWASDFATIPWADFFRIDAEFRSMLLGLLGSHTCEETT